MWRRPSRLVKWCFTGITGRCRRGSRRIWLRASVVMKHTLNWFDLAV